MVRKPFWTQPVGFWHGAVLPKRADVLVVGGGITGVSLLWHLRQRGISAILAERWQLASGASGRNAGFLLAGVAENYAAAVRAYGRARAREIWALTVENHDRQIEAAGDANVGHRRNGTLILASGPDEAFELEESAQLLREDGFQATWDGRALFNPLDGEVAPTALVAALARQAPENAICLGANVVALEPTADGVDVITIDAHCVAGVVIFAANAYTPLVLPQVRIQPTRAQMLATAPFSTRVAELPTYSHHGYRYWRQLSSGQVLIGGWRDTSLETEKTLVAEPTEIIQAHLDAAVRELGVDADVTHRWAGTMGFTESGLPIIGPVEGMKNVYVCAGFNGHGMGFAFMSAKQLVDLL
jgi:gamma-glutamylputrescine oxidase